MYSKKISKALILSISLAILFGLVFPVMVPAGEQPQEPPITTAEKLSLIEVYTWYNSLPKDLIDLQNKLETTYDIKALRKKVPTILQRLEEMEWQAATLTSNPNPTFHELSLLEVNITKLETSIQDINLKIESNIQNLEDWYKEWLLKDQEIKRLSGYDSDIAVIHDSLPSWDSQSEIVDTGKHLLENILVPTLAAGQEIGQVQTRIYELKDIAADLVRDMNKSGTQQTSPSMISTDFYKQINRQQFQNGWQHLRLFSLYQYGYFKQNLKLVSATVLLILFLGIMIHLSKSLVKPSARWHLFASRPIVSSIFIFGTVFTVINDLNITINLPKDWDSLLYLPLIFSVALLVENICRTPWQVTLLRQLMVFIAITLIFTIVSMPQVLFYLFVFYASVVLLIYYFVRFLQRLLAKDKQTFTWAITVWGIFPLIIIIAGASGYDQLAVTLFGRILSIIGTTLTTLIMFLFTSGLIELLLCQTPWKIIRDNASAIVRQITPILTLLYVYIWLAAILVVIWIHPTLNNAFATINSVQVQLYSLTVSPGSVFTVIITVYSTILISRGIRTFLLQEVLPRYNVHKGVQISITRLVHYAILLTGFLVLLGMLGFSLGQLTILGGALGVGIGFGLQAIVNNFVSGLILLFERPIKVGDMIEVGDEVGEVKELGLRATTVQTFDNAEIVIPNSELITASVTNWTLANKRVRVRVPVGVAYGTDISEVLRILLECAHNNPIVLSTPQPRALFLAFGASSLDFELRVWIPDFDDKLLVLSELNQDIEAEFQMANIEIPFPQTDLHLRSVKSDIMEKILPGSEAIPAKS